MRGEKMNELNSYIIGLLKCYKYSEKMILTEKGNTLLYAQIIKEVDKLLDCLISYDRNIIVERYINNKTIDRIAINLNYSSHSSVSTKLENIMKNMINSQ